MKTKALVDRLSHLQAYTILDDAAYDLFKLKKPEVRKVYSLDTDIRASALFQETRSDTQFKKRIPILAYTVVSLLAQIILRKPTRRQMETLLHMSGYRAEQMDIYVAENPSMTELAVLKQELLPVVYLLTRMLSEAMIDEQINKGRRIGNKQEIACISSPDGQSSYALDSPMGRLQRMVAYMRENAILSFFSEATDEYEAFVVEFSMVSSKKKIITSELHNVEREQQRLDEQLDREIFQRLEKAMRSKEKFAAVKSAIGSPLAMPIPSQVITQFMKPAFTGACETPSINLESLERNLSSAYAPR